MWRAGLAFLLGHCVVHALSVLPALVPYVFVLGGLLALAVYFRSDWVCAFLLGVCWAWINAGIRLSEDLAGELEGQDLLVRGYVASLPTPADSDPKFDFDVVRDDAVDRDLKGVRIPPRIRLSWYQTEKRPAAGELWQFVVRLKRRNGFANPGGFDYEAHLFRTCIGATGYVRDDDRNQRLGRPSARYPVLRARAWIAHRIARAVATDRHLGILQGLAVGDTQAMQPDEWSIFAATGTTHLMAISGLHISMIATLVAGCGAGVVWLPFAQRRRLTAVHAKALAGTLAAVGYSCLAGLSVPTQRTLIMLCIYFAARWWRRDPGVANALGLALIGILLLDPFAPLAAGAWLSFGAVAVILLASAGRLTRDGLVCDFTRMQLVVTIGMAPLVIGAFGGLSLVSPLANALAVPLFTICLVPLVLAGAVVASISLSGGAVVLGWAISVLDWCWPVIDWLAHRSFAVWYFPTPSLAAFTALVVGCALLVVPAIWPVRAMAVLLCLPAIFEPPPRPAPGAFNLDVLDVGQGLGVVVRTHRHTLVYDTGPAFRTGRDTGELAMLPFLRSAGVRRIDALMVSHGDLDHSGGMRSLLRGMPTQIVMAGPSVASLPATVASTRCARGQRWQWDGVAFEVLHPGASLDDSDNNSSCVLRISASAGSVLLTGDIEKPAELALVAQGLPPTEVVVVAHHGSRSSSTDELVAQAQANVAIFSAGYRNQWGFPRPEVVRRWQSSGARTLSTIDAGAIAVAIEPGRSLRIQEYRREHRRYWWTR